MDKLILISQDNMEFVVDSNFINKSDTLKKMYNEFNNCTNNIKIKIDDIDGVTLSQILTFYKLDNDKNKIACKHFIDNISADILYNIILASNYLDLQLLLKMSSEKIENALDMDPIDVIRTLKIN